MKRILFFLVFSVILIFEYEKSLHAQVLYFCEKVDQNGNPVNSSDKFYIDEEGGNLDFLVKLPYEINCIYVNYKLYDVDANGNETYNTTIKQDQVGLNWNWFWKEVTFYEAGTYNIYLYDCNDQIVTSAKLTVEFE